MVFQQFQKIQKPCLILITAFITITFGVGTALLTWANPPTYRGKIGDDVLITEEQFYSHGQTMRLTRTMEPKKNLDSEESVWVDLMVDTERQRAGVDSTLDEVIAEQERLMPPNQKREDFFRALEGRIKLSRLTEYEYLNILKRNHAIDKFRKLMGLEKFQQYYFEQFFSFYRPADASYATTLITSQQASEKIKEKKREVKVRWMSRAKKEDQDKISLKDRLARVYQENPNSFRIGKKLSGEYVVLPYQAGTLQKRSSVQELYQYYLEHREDFVEPRREATDPIIPSSFEQSKERVQFAIWRLRNQTFLPQLRKELAESKQPSLKALALKHSLLYGSFQTVLEEEFAEKVSELEEHTGSIFRLQEGEISNILNTVHGQTLVYITEEQKPYLPEFASLKDEKVKTLTAEEELALLKQFFHENLYLFEDAVQYKIEIASGEFQFVQKNYLVTTTEMKEFYEQYKDLLYGGKTFAEVRLDIEARLKKLQSGDSLPKTFTEFKKKFEGDAGQDLSFVEVAKSHGLSVVSSEKPLGMKDLKEKFPFLAPQEEQLKKLTVGRASTVFYSKEGNPFIVYMSQIKRGETPDFKAVQEKVREKLMEDELHNLSQKSFAEYQKKAQENFEAASKEADWKTSEWIASTDSGKEFPEADREALLDRIFYLKEIGTVGEMVVGKDHLYLVRLEEEKFPTLESLKKFEIIEGKDTLVADSVEPLEKRWTDFEELKDFMKLELVKKEELPPSSDEDSGL